jgi:hypothetical protein
MGWDEMGWDEMRWDGMGKMDAFHVHGCLLVFILLYLSMFLCMGVYWIRNLLRQNGTMRHQKVEHLGPEELLGGMD